MQNNYDVIVVGAGPAGLSSAKSCAENGMRTLLIEEHAVIGSPVQCGEGFSRFILEELNLPDNFIRGEEINTIELYSPNLKKCVVRWRGNKSPGLIIERKEFEKKLAVEIANRGVDVFVKTPCIGVIKENNFVRGIKVLHFGEEKEIRAKVVIGCDGPNSLIAKWSGIDVYRDLEKFDSCVQFQMANINFPRNKIEVYFGNVAPRGFIWIFSKGEKFANVGIGIKPGEKSALQYLMEFVEGDVRLKNGSIIEINAGIVPLGGVVKKFVGNGVILVGDAARMVNPAGGGGMRFIYPAGIWAGNVVSECIKKGDVSENALSEFEKIWNKNFGSRFKTFKVIAKIFEEMEDKELDALFEDIGTIEVKSLDKSKEFLYLIIKKFPALLKRPKLLLKLASAKFID